MPVHQTAWQGWYTHEWCAKNQDMSQQLYICVLQSFHLRYELKWDNHLVQERLHPVSPCFPLSFAPIPTSWYCLSILSPSRQLLLRPMFPRRSCSEADTFSSCGTHSGTCAMSPQECLKSHLCPFKSAFWGLCPSMTSASRSHRTLPHYG